MNLKTINKQKTRAKVCSDEAAATLAPSFKKLQKRILREKEVQDVDIDVIGGKKVGPLHLAKSNDRSVGIILHFMACVKQNCSKNFQDVLGDCIDNPFFIEYISNLPF